MVLDSVAIRSSFLLSVAEALVVVCLVVDTESLMMDFLFDSAHKCWSAIGALVVVCRSRTAQLAGALIVGSLRAPEQAR